ncbi:MAG TPA: RHS repeat domain-containing protein, partial [Gallionellaceae bacterium]|nr:RHS repeat domain-containing protein [Gallionellaceae bacterium]
KGNDVSYEYGAASLHNNLNQIGRLTKVTDASGHEEREYGKLGETVKEMRTIASHTQGSSANSPEVYTTQYQYDTFGRILTLTLPDTETITYAYDAGGNLNTLFRSWFSCCCLC